MSNLYVSSEYKNKIINLLLNNKNFIKLINPTESEHEDIDTVDVLLGGSWIIDGKKYTEQGYVFDYNFVNEATTEKKTFVFVETDIDTIRDNIFTDFNLYVAIFTDKDLVRLDTTTIPTAKQVKGMGYYATSKRANRIDALCDCVDRVLNGTDKLKGLGDVKPASRNHMQLYLPNAQYYGKILKYNISNYNSGGDTCED